MSGIFRGKKWMGVKHSSPQKKKKEEERYGIAQVNSTEVAARLTAGPPCHCYALAGSLW